MKQKYYKITQNKDSGVISFNGAAGYLTANEGEQFYLIYSTGMIGSYYDLTPEIQEILDNHFSDKQ